MVSRSLRWDVNPQKEDSELAEWFKYFNEAGVNFLQFLIAKKKRKLTVLDSEINNIKSKLMPFKSESEYMQRSDALKSIFNKEESEQKMKKKRKYNRDVKDYSDNVVFRWQVIAPSDPSPVTTLTNSQSIPVVNGEITTRHASPKPPRGRLGSQQHQGQSRGRGGGKGSLPRPNYHSPPPWRHWEGQHTYPQLYRDT